MDKLSYAIGMMLGQHLVEFGYNNLNLDDFSRGVKHYLQEQDKLEVEPEEAQELLRKHMEDTEKLRHEMRNKMIEKLRAEGDEFLQEYAKEDGVIKTSSGLMYKVIQEGTGKQPSKHDHVKCHYEGRFTNDDIFDSSYRRGEAAEFGLDQVIAGWTEGVSLMKEGGIYELVIPYELGYGERGIPDVVPPCSVLKFKVELIEVLK